MRIRLTDDLGLRCAKEAILVIFSSHRLWTGAAYTAPSVERREETYLELELSAILLAHADAKEEIQLTTNKKLENLVSVKPS